MSVVTLVNGAGQKEIHVQLRKFTWIITLKKTKLFSPWFFDLQTEDWPNLYGESYSYYGDEGGSGLTIIRENHHSCQLAENTV